MGSASDGTLESVGVTVDHSGDEQLIGKVLPVYFTWLDSRRDFFNGAGFSDMDGTVGRWGPGQEC